MKKPVESVHQMALRGRRQLPNESSDVDRHQDEDVSEDTVSSHDEDENQEIHEEQSQFLTCVSSPLKCHIYIPGELPFILISTLCIMLFHTAFAECESQENSIPVCNTSLLDLKQKYPEHELVWKSFDSVVRLTSVKRSPGVVLLLHNGNGDIVNCLVNITARGMSCSFEPSKAGKFSHIDGRTAHKLYPADEFLEKILMQMQDVGVTVFTHLEQLDLKLVPYLHFICDSDPNISNKKTLVMLVLQVDTETFNNVNLYNLAQQRLSDLWKGNLAESRIEPIFGRLLNNVVSVNEHVDTKCQYP